MTDQAQLIADGGDAAASEKPGKPSEFFRSRAFFTAEGVTHTLVIEGEAGSVALPLIVREVPGGGGLLDATSPYGYPGGKLHGEAPDPAAVDWAGAGLVSLFIRERVGAPRSLAGGRERSLLQIADPELPPKSRMSDRQQIRKNEARGYEWRFGHGPNSRPGDRSGFRAAYEQTMRRAGAAARYFFGPEYFDAVLSSKSTWLGVCDAPEGGGVAAAAIVVSSDGFLHYYLSGTADEHLAHAPSKNLISGAIEFAKIFGAPLNLGGGVRPGDGLEEFKRGFANRRAPFVTHEVVCDPPAYERLSAGLGETEQEFFPLYRAP